MNAKRFWSPFIPFSLISFLHESYSTKKEGLKPQGWWAHIRLSHEPHFLSPASTFPSEAWMPPPHRQQFFGQNPWVSAAAILDAKGSKTHHSIRLYTYTCCQKFLTFIWTKTIGSILAIMVGFTKTVFKPHCKKGLWFFFLLLRRYILLSSHLVTTWNSGQD